MIKRLLNPNILLKITLILTTLLLLPSTAWGTEYTTGNITRGENNKYIWSYTNEGFWNIEVKNINNTNLPDQSSGEVASLSGSFTNSSQIILTTNFPNDGTTHIRKININGSLSDCTFSFKKIKSNNSEEELLPSQNEYEFNFENSTNFIEGDAISIIISGTAGKTFEIHSVRFQTGTKSDVEFQWPEAPTPTSGNIDIGSFKKVVLGDNGVQVQGHCLNKTEFSFPLVCNQPVNITYSSNKHDVAEVDENGIVRVNGKGQAIITATPQATDDIFYEPSQYSYTLDITSIDELCIDGTFVNYNNKDDIRCDAITSGKVSYNSQNQTLTLDGATINGTISSSINELTIDLKGTNTINVTKPDSSAIQTLDGAGEINLVIGSTSGPKGTLTMTTLNRETIYGYHISYSNNIIGADYDHYSCIGEDYNLTIAQKAVNSVNASNVLRDDYNSVSYDHESTTLTLKGTEIANMDFDSVIGGDGITSFTVHLIGRNQIGGSGKTAFKFSGNTQLAFTTNEDLPGTLITYGNLSEGVSDVIDYQNGLTYDNDNKQILKTSNNTTIDYITGNATVITSQEGAYYIATQPTAYYASTAELSSTSPINIKVPSAENKAAIWPRSVSNVKNIKRVAFQFDWGKCTNKDVTVHIEGVEKISSDTEYWQSDNKSHSESFSLLSANADGIIEIPITNPIENGSIQLCFSSSDPFSIIPLSVALISYDTYDLSFNNELISELNKDDIFGDEKASYDPKEHILTLKGVNLTPNGPAEVAGWNYMGNKELTVILEGENTITNAIFYNRSSSQDLNIRFLTNSTKPGSLTMIKSGSTPSSDFNQRDFIWYFNIVYDNTYYDYSTSGNEAEGYASIYKVSILKPEINCEETEDGVQLYISDPSDSNGTIKYSVVYGDGSEGITEAEYSETPKVPTIEKPATITAYIESGDKKSGTITAYYFGFADDLKTTFNGTEREIQKSEFPALIPKVDGVDFMLSNSDNPYAICLETVDDIDHIMIKGFGTADLILYINHDENINVLNSGDGAVALTANVIPSAPTFSVEAGTYNEAKTLTLTSHYQKTNADDPTIIEIKYSTSELPNTSITYSELEPIAINHSTTISAWVVARTGAQETYASDTISRAYIIKEEAPIDFKQEKNGVLINIEANQVITGTYGNTIPKVGMSDISNLQETITFSSSNEAVVASSSISLDEGNTLKYTISSAGQTTIQAVYTPADNEPLLPTTRSFILKIEPRDITNATISMGTNGETSYVYNGSAIEPITSVSLAASETATAATLKEGTDFNLNYYQVNGETESALDEAPVNAGSYKVTVSAKGNYIGSKSVTFDITKATISPTVTLEGWTYGTTANTPEVKGNTGNGAETFTYKAEGTETFTSEVPTAVGTHTVKVTIAETTNYNGGEATATFTIINRTFDAANDITFAEGQTYASFYSSDEDLVLPESGIAAYLITGIEGNTLTTQAVSYIPKATPVLIEKTETAFKVKDPSEVETNMLQYATEDVATDGTLYILYNGEYVKATGTIPQGKCYLKPIKPSGSRRLTIGHNNGTTSISSFDAETGTDRWYDLNGQRISKPQKKGLYIKNGKKIIVK